MIKEEKIELNNWSSSTEGIKVQLTFFVYAMFIVSFCMLFFLAKDLTIINTGSLTSIPVLIMMYSTIMVIIANIIGKKFESPFKTLKENTQEIIKINDFNNIKDYQYGVLELDLLQQFITNQLKINYYNSKSQIELNEHIMTAIHNIRSPLTILNNLVTKIQPSISEQQVFKFRKQISSIGKITDKLLDHNRYIANNVALEESFHVLSVSLKQLVENKQLEWEKNIIQLEVPDEIIWLKFVESDFQNTLSNILNNSYAAISKKGDGYIKIVVKACNNYIKLNISDNGCGIPKNELENIKKGKSLKIKGNGIGVPSAIKYIKSLNGKLEIDSEELVGTDILITLPFILPMWSINSINISDYNIIVLDNDPEILEFWADTFHNSHKVQYFSVIKQFVAWCANETNLDDFLVLMDYELGENNIYGLDLLIKYQIPNAIIVSDYGEHAWLQDQISKTNYCLLPKVALDIVRLI